MDKEDDIAISVEELWKRYGVENPEILYKVDQTISRITGKPQRDDIWALRDISFKVRKGETFGIIGRNGAGKSTLLKVLSGVTPPSRGSIIINGTIFPMIELNAGMHMDFSGRENVRLLGTIMGLESKKIDLLMNEIIEFCELGEWFDRPVRHYSSGMIARLGFGVGVNINADILIIDEVLSVGDFSFQRKCFNKMEKIRNDGVTIIFVSHNIRMVNRLCERTLYLESGKIVNIGDSDEICHLYYNNEISREYTVQKKVVVEDYRGTGEIICENLDLIDRNNQSIENVYLYEDLIIQINYNAIIPVFDPIFVIGIYTPDNVQAIIVSSIREEKLGLISGKGNIICKIKKINLLPGTYWIRVGITLFDGRVCYKKENLKCFKISSADDIEQVHAGLLVPTVFWKYNDNY
nr:ABC transporter ATP-binding protein [uncultured Methanospirillum sp.]